MSKKGLFYCLANLNDTPDNGIFKERLIKHMGGRVWVVDVFDKMPFHSGLEIASEYFHTKAEAQEWIDSQ